MMLLGMILILSSVFLVIIPAHLAYAFMFKITIFAVDATSDMGKMKVKVTVKEKEHSFSSDKGKTMSKTVDIGKTALKEDESDFKVASFIRQLWSYF